MEPAKGYYSLIQYCPDESRLETLNVGVALFCPVLRTVRVRFAENPHIRIKRIFKPLDRGPLEGYINAVKERLERGGEEFQARDDFARFAATRSNAIVLTVPRFVKVYDLDETALSLFNRLVGESQQTKRAHKVTGKFGRILRTEGVLQLVMRNVEVAIPQLGKTLRASYGYQNGRFNLIQPEQFGLSDDEQVIQKASRVAVEGGFLRDDPDPELGKLQLVVVAEFRHDQIEAPARVRAIFEKNDVKMYNFNELDPLINDIKLNAQRHGHRELI
jgi:hypothetical protein